MRMLLIKNSILADPASGTTRRADVLIAEGRILKIAENLPSGTASPEVLTEMPAGASSVSSAGLAESRENAGSREPVVLDGSGCVLAPGLIDTHVHFRDPGYTEKEDIETGARAAKRGGFTTVVMMANTNPVIDAPELVRANLEKGKATGIHVLQAAAVTRGMRGKELSDLEALAAAGAACFTDDGLPITDEKLLFEALREAAKLGLSVSLHEEDPAFIASQGVNAGPMAEALGLGGASALAEEVLVARDVLLAANAGASLVIQHISSGLSVKLLRAAKSCGIENIHAEATPHHFSLTEAAVLSHGTFARMNPPLRTEADRLEIIRGLADGTIDLIATDHAPHTTAEKNRPFGKAPSGIIGLETSLALGVTNLVRPGHLPLLELLRKMTVNPARLLGLPVPRIEAGAPADLVLFAPDETFVAGSYASKAENSPFTGETLFAPVKATICGGKIVYKA